jgi:hypothetical protein
MPAAIAGTAAPTGRRKRRRGAANSPCCAAPTSAACRLRRARTRDEDRGGRRASAPLASSLSHAASLARMAIRTSSQKTGVQHYGDEGGCLWPIADISFALVRINGKQIPWVRMVGFIRDTAISEFLCCDKKKAGVYPKQQCQCFQTCNSPTGSFVSRRWSRQGLLKESARYMRPYTIQKAYAETAWSEGRASGPATTQDNSAHQGLAPKTSAAADTPLQMPAIRKAMKATTRKCSLLGTVDAQAVGRRAPRQGQTGQQCRW